MATDLVGEISKFHEQASILKQINWDTNKVLQEIRNSGCFSQDANSAYLPEEDADTLSRVCETLPTVVVIGQSRYAKVVVVNELLGEAILPDADDLDSSTTSWRTVRLKFGPRGVSLVLPDSYVLASTLNSFESEGQSVPRRDLEIKSNDRMDPALALSVAEVTLPHPLLKAGAQIVCSSTGPDSTSEQKLQVCCEGAVPVIIYAMEYEELSEQDMYELSEIQAIDPDIPLFFAQCNRKTQDSTESDREFISGTLNKCGATKTFQQLCEVGFLSAEILTETPPLNSNLQNGNLTMKKSELSRLKPKSKFISGISKFSEFTCHLHKVLQHELLLGASVLNEHHSRVLGMFIAAAYDLQRDMIVTPKRLEYAKKKEEELFTAMMESASRKQEEIKGDIRQTITYLTPKLVEDAAAMEFVGVELTDSDQLVNAADLTKCTYQLQDLLLKQLNKSLALKLVSSVQCLKESFLGTLQRCIESLESYDKEEKSKEENSHAVGAFKQILDSAYQMEATSRTVTLVRFLFEKIQQALTMLPGKTPVKVDIEWKKKVALDLLANLSESRLAKTLCSQFKMRLKNSHESFLGSMKVIALFHNGRLEKTEVQSLKVRKMHAPKVARLVLESTSLRDLILYGMPDMGREIGRGQYGVVYSCDKWAGTGPCALKSVVPPDDKHWNDLAMEFCYTRSLPAHERIVGLLGSVIDYSYAGGGCCPAVLLVMKRLNRDLHHGLKNGLQFPPRLQIALDVIQGIRFLHSQGLIHRDIKLKNVLLDGANRAKITDLGFCKPEAMMSGSIVGTPIHMAPELFSGRYDGSVDVYAFGILFWYICSGQVRLPLNFEQCSSKDQLWTCVKKGTRPERLQHFSDECWTLMEKCWDGVPEERPLPGSIEITLGKMREMFENQKKTKRK